MTFESTYDRDNFISSHPQWLAMEDINIDAPFKANLDLGLGESITLTPKDIDDINHGIKSIFISSFMRKV